MEIKEQLKLDSTFTLGMAIASISIVIVMYYSYRKLDFSTLLISIIMILTILAAFITIYLSTRKSLKESENDLIKEVVEKKFDKKSNKSFSEQQAEFFRKELDKLNIKKKYKAGVLEAIDIFEITYHRTAIMVLGRTLEESIDDYLSLANKKHKLRLSNLNRNRKSFHDRIEYLEKNKVIDKTEESLMKAVKLDRNIGSHTKNKKEVEKMVKRVKNIFSVGMQSIETMQEKIDLLGK